MWIHRRGQVNVSRQLGEVFLPMARKPYTPDDPSTRFDFELGDVHRLRDWRKI